MEMDKLSSLLNLLFSRKENSVERSVSLTPSISTSELATEQNQSLEINDNANRMTRAVQRKERYKKFLEDLVESELARNVTPNPEIQTEESNIETNECESIFKGPFPVKIKDLEPMSDVQMKLVHRALLDAMRRTAKGSGPSFLGFTHKSGAIHTMCEDRGSEQWLTNEVANIKLWPGALLYVVPESNAPTPYTATTFIPWTEAENIEEALELLRNQNVGLNTELWRLVNRRTENDGFLMTCCLDEASVEELKFTQFRASLGFRKVAFHISDTRENDDSPICDPSEDMELTGVNQSVPNVSAPEQWIDPIEIMPEVQSNKQRKICNEIPGSKAPTSKKINKQYNLKGVSKAKKKNKKKKQKLKVILKAPILTSIK